MTTRSELEAWLGPALPDLTDDQMDRLTVEADRITACYPDPDEQPERDAALSAATQYLLGETTIDDAGRALTAARLELERAMAAAKQLAAMASADGMPDTQAAQRACIDRMTLLKVLGKR
jgi:hypothetical protein